jgi:D-3-phosphoglycerate dehydrogenase
MSNEALAHSSKRKSSRHKVRMSSPRFRKILIGPSSFAELDKTPRLRLASAGFEIVENPFKRKLAKPELLQLLAEDVVGLLAGLETLDREVLRQSHLKVVSRVGAGISNVDLVAAKELGIEVRYTPSGPMEAVAEMTVGVMLNLIRLVPQMDQALHAERWLKKIGMQLEGKTIAIVGFGRIGRRVAELLAPFRVRIVVVDPFLDQDAVLPFEKLSLDEALPLADIITLHSSGEDCILDEKAFAQAKPGVYLLNAARGGLVSEAALLKALDSGRVAGAWFDTFREEPYSGPLCKYPNVILTPHVGSYTQEGRQQMENEAVDNLLDALGARA